MKPLVNAILDIVVNITSKYVYHLDQESRKELADGLVDIASTFVAKSIAKSVHEIDNQ